MGKFNMKEWVNGIIANPKTVAIPIMTHPGIELIGKTVKDAVTDGQVHYEAIKILNDKYPSAAATVIMDLTVEAEAFGAEIVFPENEVPAVTGRLLADDAAIDALQIPDLNKGRVQEYLKANKLSAENINDRPVLGGCIGPYSLAGRLFDMSEMMMLPYINPDAAKKLLEKCNKFIMEYCRALKATGVNGVVIAEPAAGLMSNEDCEQYSSVYVKQIVDELQDDSFAIILHNCGNTGHCTPAMVYTGSMGYHFGNKIDMKEAAKEVPADALAMGNLDPVSVFKMSSAKKVRQETLDLLEKMKDFPNFVLSSGCDTPPESPLANVDAFYEALNEYNNA